MNEINFNIEDIEKIDLSMDVGIKEIYPPIEDLEVTPKKEQQVFTHENSYGYDEVIVKPIPDSYTETSGTLTITENGEHNVKEYEKVVANIHEASKYRPKYISFYNTTERDLTEETRNLDTSLITNMSKMLYAKDTGILTHIDVSGWDTSNVTDMSYLFYFGNMPQLDLKHFNTSKVTTIAYMFYYNKNLTSLDVSTWDTSKVTSMANTFGRCINLTSLDLSSFNTSNVTSMANMFVDCYKLTSLDLSNFNTSKVTNMMQIFNSCSSLKHLDIRNFTFTKVSNTVNMFAGMPADCEIIVKDDTARNWILARRSDFTNIKTVAEL